MSKIWCDSAHNYSTSTYHTRLSLHTLIRKLSWGVGGVGYHYNDGQRWGGSSVTFQGRSGSIQWHLVPWTHVTTVSPAHWAQEQDHTGWTTHNPLLLTPCPAWSRQQYRWHLNRGSLFIPANQNSTVCPDGKVKFSPVSPWSSQRCCVLFKPRRITASYSTLTCLTSLKPVLFCKISPPSPHRPTIVSSSKSCCCWVYTLAVLHDSLSFLPPLSHSLSLPLSHPSSNTHTQWLQLCMVQPSPAHLTNHSLQ